ncbi:hypothetical protein GF377_05975 [candidate division GN15 bacterium]|nr:hypothetical protein [candidate division GN15 bacterium]
MTPETASHSMDTPEVHSFETIHQRTLGLVQARKRPRVALVSPTSAETADAFGRAIQDGLLDPIVVGRETDIAQHFTEHQSLLNGAVVGVSDATEAVARAIAMIDAGEVDAIVQGGIRPTPFLAALFDHAHQFRLPGRTISHVAVLNPASYPKLLFLTDSAVMVAPDLKGKMNLLANLATVAEKVGVKNPRVAVLGAVEAVYPQMQATLDGAVLAKMAERHQVKGLRVDGPLSFDVAVDMAAARSKGVTTSEVAGQADGLLAPNIEVANGIYNAMSLYGNAGVGGVLVGGRVPVAMHSRADNADARYNSIVLAVLMAG